MRLPNTHRRRAVVRLDRAAANVGRLPRERRMERRAAGPAEPDLPGHPARAFPTASTAIRAESTGQRAGHPDRHLRRLLSA